MCRICPAAGDQDRQTGQPLQRRPGADALQAERTRLHTGREPASVPTIAECSAQDHNRRRRIDRITGHRLKGETAFQPEKQQRRNHR